MKKVITSILIGAMVFMAGCSSTSQNTSTTETAETTETKGTLTMATSATFPPYEYFENNTITGIDVEIAQAIGEELGYTIVVEDMDFGSVIASVTSGKSDIGMAGMTVTEDRLQSVNFTTSYTTAKQVIIVPEGSTITGPDDLAGKKIGVQQDTTGDIYGTSDYGDDSIERYVRGADAILSLTQGKIDAVIIDVEPAKSFVAANEGLVILETEYAIEDYAIAIAKENTELLEEVNGALEKLIENGTVEQIINKYISAE
ncbi:MAG: ABC transporter substrate-binding protein [Anaerotignaceae bacterium]